MPPADDDDNNNNNNNNSNPPPTRPKIKTIDPSSLPSPSARSSPPPTQNRYTPPALQPSVLLSDAIGPPRLITTFSSLTRLLPSPAALLADPAARTTVLAPLNTAVERLPRKPWQDPEDAEPPSPSDKLSSEEHRSRNLESFVSAHLIPVAPWERGPGHKVRTLAGREIWWEERAGVRVVCPDGVEIERVAGRVANGELWFLSGVLAYE